MPDDADLVTFDEAAHLLGVSVKRITQLLSDGELVAAPGSGRFVRRARFGEPLESGAAVTS